MGRVTVSAEDEGQSGQGGKLHLADDGALCSLGGGRPLSLPQRLAWAQEWEEPWEWSQG